MTTILTWNIQCGLGVDGRVDLVRLADVIRSMADADVICLQEVSRFNPELDGGENVDQVAALTRHELHDGRRVGRDRIVRARQQHRFVGERVETAASRDRQRRQKRGPRGRPTAHSFSCDPSQ